MKIKRHSAFTLIELLVVISIIAVLAGIALPAFTSVQKKSAQTKVLSNGKQIAIACKSFAIDYHGQYPTKKLDNNGKLTTNEVADANEAFGQLLPDYLSTESIFFCAGSKFTPAPGDDKFSNEAEKLGTGENHFAYVKNQTETSPGSWPLIADGFTSESGHTYSKQKHEKGGVWSGTHAIVIRVDGSGAVEKLTKAYKVPGSPNGDDLFVNTNADWMGSDNVVVNPK